MFDFVLRRSVLPRRSFGPALGIATAFYAGAAGFVTWAESQPRAVDRQDVLIKFVAPPRVAPPPRTPPPAPVPVSRPAVARVPALKQILADQPRTVLAQAIVAPTEIPKEKPPEQEPVAVAAADASGSEAYEVPAVPGGIGSDPVVDAAVVELVHALPALGGGPAGRMVPPRFVSGPTPTYTEKAIEREVEGVMEVRCVVSIDGRVHDCQVLKSLPFMDRAVIDALEHRRYAPATLGGQAVDVYYRFRLPFRLSDVGET
jgi:protein TonB